MALVSRLVAGVRIGHLIASLRKMWCQFRHRLGWVWEAGVASGGYSPLSDRLMEKLKYRSAAWVAGLRYLLLLYRLFGKRFNFLFGKASEAGD